MSKYYLFILPEPLQQTSLALGNTIWIDSSSELLFEEDDRFLLVKPKGTDYETVMSVVAIKLALLDSVKESQTRLSKRWVNLEIEKVYNKEVPIDRVRAILNRSLSGRATELTQTEFIAIVSQMGGVMLKESELLDYIKRYISAKGYYFDDETIDNYHICLKTRPFVILAGLSGTGKSKLSQLYAEAMGHTVQNKRYLRLAVRPSWNDDRYLLGYLNSITGEYVTEPAVDFIMKAEENRENLYFFCLDEMNLAHVEYYFSQFLSALEEDNSSDRWIPLMSERAQANLSVHTADRVLISPNLLFTGTINVDETTQPLSDKVIDRANTIEFFAVELDKIPERKPLPDPIDVTAATWQSYINHEPDTTFRAHVIEIGKILNKADLGLGYRVMRDIELYLANSKNLLRPEVAFDLQVKQRILPRVRGTEAILPVLDELVTFMKRNKLTRSENRLDEMKVRLKRDGYTNFWR